MASKAAEQLAGLSGNCGQLYKQVLSLSPSFPITTSCQLLNTCLSCCSCSCCCSRLNCCHTPAVAVEDVKLALLSCLAAWLPKCTPTPPAAAVQQLAAGLGEAKESLRRGNLRAAAAAVKAAPGLAGAMGPLAAPLAKIVSEGCAKAVARADGVAALLLAAQVAAADSTAGVWGWVRHGLGET